MLGDVAVRRVSTIFKATIKIDIPIPEAIPIIISLIFLFFLVILFVKKV